jgi:hypothetical protein
LSVVVVLAALQEPPQPLGLAAAVLVAALFTQQIARVLSVLYIP